MNTYVVGDLQGCYEELQRLLDKIRFDPATDRLWFVGDLVNRGPGSLACLRYIESLGERAVTVLGNHDLHLLVVAEGLAKAHRGDTIDEVLKAPDCDKLLHWLRHRPLLYRAAGHVMVHAGLLPQWSVDKACELAREVEDQLQGPGYRDFLAVMLGNEPAVWRDELTGFDRLRVIINAMTRLRFCTPEGRMDFTSKGGAEDAPAGFLPWFEAPDRQSAESTVVFGHWASLGLKIAPNIMALDSGCVWGRTLTAVRLEDRSVFQVDCSG